ncbi:hypothetical protein BGZ58_007564 [Dissophora ornata]|nr:hypothetical protein BGZ58_007564 [Dissophora ornata]
MQSIGHDLRRGLNNFSLGNNYKNINKWLGELKNVDASLKRLDKEISSNAKLISGWGCNEGDDLTDVCQRMTQLMEEVGLIHQSYSIQHTAHRKKIKGLKTQEMTLDDNRKKKHDLTNQLAKHQKSSKENPIKIMEIQSALERVSADLLAQELELLQFKRLTIRDAFNDQFDAMIEFGEKMALIAGYGRQITNVIDVGPQEAYRTTLYSGAEYTAAAVSQVKIAVTSWQAQPVGNPIRPHVAPSQDELALSAAATAYNNRTPPLIGHQYEGSPVSQSTSFVNGGTGDKISGYWDEVQMLKVDPSQTSLHDGHGSDFDNWKQEIQGAGDRTTDYISPPASNPDASPYTQSPQMNHLQEQQRQLQAEQKRARQLSLTSSYSPSQQHYQNAAATNTTGLRHSGGESYGNLGGSAGTGPGGRPFTPSMLRERENGASPSPAYNGYQQQPASYEDGLSPAQARGSYRMGFTDPRERSRMERMDNSDLYKTEIGPTIASRYSRNQVVLEEK